MIAKNRFKKIQIVTCQSPPSMQDKVGQNQTSFEKPRVSFLPEAYGNKINPELRLEAAPYFHKVKGPTGSRPYFPGFSCKISKT